MRKSFTSAFWLASILAGATVAQSAQPVPTFKEVQGLIQSNWVNSTQESLDRAAMEGLIRQLSPQVAIVTNGQTVVTQAASPVLTRNIAIDGTFGYIQIGRVESTLPAELSKTMSSLESSNKIKGWVLDLRFTEGTDYKAACEVADRFIPTEQPLVDWGQGVVRSKAKTTPDKTPLIILINRRTSGAAEAIAAVTRQARAALLIGTNTAGHGFITKDFPLSNGQSLRIATSMIKIGEGELMPAQGVVPDIVMSLPLKDEKAFMNDPFKSAGTALDITAAATPPSTSTNRIRHRVNEAELVRQLRDGQGYDEENISYRSADSQKPVIQDPVLARAIDLLKGLAVVKRSRP